MKTIYRPGYLFQKAGVMLLDLSRRNYAESQGSLFTPMTAESQTKAELTRAIDQLNQRHGRGTVRLGTQGFDNKGWRLRSNHHSPHYTTNWLELPGVK